MAKKPQAMQAKTSGRPRKKCKCGEGMFIYKLAKNWRSVWRCEKCGNQVNKTKGDVEYWG